MEADGGHSAGHSGVTPVRRSGWCESSCGPRGWAGRLTSCRRREGSGTRPEQVVRKLTEADRLLAQGADVAEVARQLGVSEQTYFRWRNQFGGLKAEDAKRLKELEKENARLKRLLAEAELEKDALREIAKGEF
jgi:putative transposase